MPPTKTSGQPTAMHYAIGKTPHSTAIENPQYLLFSSANYSLNEQMPATLSIVGGKAYNLFVNPQVHGLVIIENGRPRMINLKEFEDIPSLIRATLDSGGTMFQTNLLVAKGRNIVPSEGSSGSDDKRRALVTYADGSYGFVQINEYLTLHQFGAILAKIPGIVSAVNLDTGGCNIGGYRDQSGRMHEWGIAKYSSSTLLYISRQ